jgi:hypothetical protein
MLNHPISAAKSTPMDVRYDKGSPTSHPYFAYVTAKRKPQFRDIIAIIRKIKMLTGLPTYESTLKFYNCVSSECDFCNDNFISLISSKL